MNNRQAKEKLIKLFGAECFIEKLHLRRDTERRYTSKAQYERMKQLSYHHIREKRNGGKATVENGALLSVENHQWFNQQKREEQQKMNEMFQKYKVGAVEVTTEGIVQAKEIKIDMRDTISIPVYSRAKSKAELRKELEEYEEMPEL